MKCRLPLAITILSMATGILVPAAAQDPVATAAREEAEERFRTLSARVERLEESINTFQNRIVSLAREIEALRDDMDRQKNRNENAATLEKIGRLQDAIKKVDEARQEDNKKVLAEISRLRTFFEKAVKGIASVPPAPPPESSSTRPSDSGTKSPPENGYEYEIKKGDTLTAIIVALRSQGYKVSQKQMEEANPGVNWTRLRIGQKIFIPPPSP